MNIEETANGLMKQYICPEKHHVGEETYIIVCYGKLFVNEVRVNTDGNVDCTLTDDVNLALKSKDYHQLLALGYFLHNLDSEACFVVREVA